MSYMIEGGGSRTLTKSKAWLYKYPEQSAKLLDQLSEVVIDYLVEQVKAGAQVFKQSIFVQINENTSNTRFSENRCCKFSNLMQTCWDLVCLINFAFQL